MELYAQLDREQPGKNLFFSPTSISLALAMTAAGPRPDRPRWPRCCTSTPTWPGPRPLSSAPGTMERGGRSGRTNSAWPIGCGGRRAIAIRPEFLALTRQQYGAEMQLLDFAQAEAASREINRWVEQQTNDKIKDLIPAGSLDADPAGADQRRLLQGRLGEPFDKRNTHEEDFTVSAEEKVKMPLMHQKTKFGYAEEETFQALEMPYAGRELSMVVLCRRRRTACRSWRRRSRSRSSPR